MFMYNGLSNYNPSYVFTLLIYLVFYIETGLITSIDWDVALMGIRDVANFRCESRLVHGFWLLYLFC